MTGTRSFRAITSAGEGLALLLTGPCTEDEAYARFAAATAPTPTTIDGVRVSIDLDYDTSEMVRHDDDSWSTPVVGIHSVDVEAADEDEARAIGVTRLNALSAVLDAGPHCTVDVSSDSSWPDIIAIDDAHAGTPFAVGDHVTWRGYKVRQHGVVTSPTDHAGRIGVTLHGSDPAVAENLMDPQHLDADPHPTVPADVRPRAIKAVRALIGASPSRAANVVDGRQQPPADRHVDVCEVLAAYAAGLASGAAVAALVAAEGSPDVTCVPQRLSSHAMVLTMSVGGQPAVSADAADWSQVRLAVPGGRHDRQPTGLAADHADPLTVARRLVEFARAERA